MSSQISDSTASFETSAWINSGMETPFIFLDYRSDTMLVKGVRNAFVGHRMTLPDDMESRGFFAQWSLDDEKLQARVDKLGYFPLFVYSKGDQLGISPSILRLLEQGADPTPDTVALAVFHRLGFFVNCDTPFKYIRVLPPGGELAWKDKHLTITDKPISIKGQSLNRKQAVEAMIEIPRMAIRKFVNSWQGPIALPLSGGRDSRHILLEMVRQRRKPDTCVTFHHGGRVLNGEVQAARAVAARAGVHHTILGHPRMRLRDSLRGILMTQFCSDEHAQMIPMHDFLSGRDAELGMAALDGLGGDILSNPEHSMEEFMAFSQKGDYEGISRRLCTGHASIISRPGYSGGAGTVLSPDLEDSAIARISDALRAYDNTPDPYVAFCFWQRSRRELSLVSTAVMGGAAMVFCPYLDPEMVDVYLSLPWSITQDSSLHNDAIRQAFPEYADIPFSEGFTARKMSPLRLHRLSSLLDSLIISSKIQPHHPVQAFAKFLRSTPLKRSPSDVYRLHSEFVSSMDDQRARYLIELGTQLKASAMRKEIISEVFTVD